MINYAMLTGFLGVLIVGRRGSLVGESIPFLDHEHPAMYNNVQYLNVFN